ncbi:hypothetical protein H4582DRAFT_2061593 [Lactarius indigo]|nr:hypothetical protein H4582DRAFT_2061593 [Lactarius indigo]
MVTHIWRGGSIQCRGPGGHNAEGRTGFEEWRADHEPKLGRNCNGTCTRMAIVDRGNLDAWHVTSATAPAPTVTCANDTDVLDRQLGAWLSFVRLMRDHTQVTYGRSSWRRNAENQNLTGAAETKMENMQTPSPLPLLDGNDNSLFAAVMHLNAYPTALLLFSGDGNRRLMSTLAARRAEYQLARSWGRCGALEHDRALEEAVARMESWMGSLFVGAKT